MVLIITQNLKFQRVDSDSIRALSDKPVLILTATYLKTVADRTINKIMVYTLTDSDTNKDGKISKDEWIAFHTKMFQKMDKNGDGLLDEDEMRPPRPEDRDEEK